MSSMLDVDQISIAAKPSVLASRALVGSGAGGWLATMALLGVALSLLLWRWWANVRASAIVGPTRPAWRRVAAEEGTATVEFALVFPVLLVMILALIQTTLAFTGQLFVNYAAFVAARAAIVEVPQDLGREGPNVVLGGDSQKLENVRAAAAFALMPVSGPGDRRGPTADRPVGTAVDALYAAESLDTPRWSEGLADRRLAYALDHTDVQLMALGEGPADIGTDTNADAFRSGLAGRGGTDFGYEVSPNAADGARYAYGSREPIQVVVRHRFHLSVPFAGRLFSSGTHTVDGMTTPYRLVTSSFALTNEGVWRDLPDQPSVEREP
ncbi:MAG: TadE family protein [Planctomycetota bacterium]